MRRPWAILMGILMAWIPIRVSAMGPWVSGIPDVYIGSESATGVPPEIAVNMFRYSEALVLWDYVHPYMVFGDGSTSDTLYWGWAARKAPSFVPLDEILNPSLPPSDPDGIVYSIQQENSLLRSALYLPSQEGTLKWAEELNAALGEHPEYSVASAGALTFRNIRLSPPPDWMDYPGPIPNVDIPAGYLDLQDVTFYATDGVTIPVQWDHILVATIDNNFSDMLSSAFIPPWYVEVDLHHTTPLSAFGFSQLTADSTTPVDLSPTGLSTWKADPGVFVQTAVTNTPTGHYYYGQWAASPTETGLVLDPSQLYRVRAALNSTNADPAANPQIRLGLNNRSGGVGFGYTELVKGFAGIPQAPDSREFRGYLKPATSGEADVVFAVFDDGDSLGGTLSASSLVVESTNLEDIYKSTNVTYILTFDVASAPAIGNVWGGFSSAYPGRANPIWSFFPSVGTLDAPTLIITGSTGGNANNVGFAQIGTAGVFSLIPETIEKLLVVEWTVSTTSSDSADIPDLGLVVINDKYQGNFMMNRTAASTSGPSITPRMYSVVLDAVPGSYDLAFRAFAEQPTVNGSLALWDITVTLFEMPYAPPL